jgi:site-specific recombinase XerD
MGPRRRHAAAKTRSERRKVRSKLGKLKDLCLKPSTIIRYRKSLVSFEEWRTDEGMREAQTHEELDAQLCECLEHRWAEGEQKSDCGTLLSAVQHFGRCRGKIPGAWKLLGAWSRMEVPNRAPPLTAFMVSSLVGKALMRKQTRVAAVLWLGFSACLRTGEMLKLKCGDIQITSGDTMTVALKDTKTSERSGGDHCAVIDDEHVIELCQRAVRGRKSNESLLGLSSYEFRQVFDDLLQTQGLSKFEFRPYSIRRGGATHLFQQKVPMERILLLGRWKSLATAKIYLQDGAARIAEQRLPAASRSLGEKAIAAIHEFLNLNSAGRSLCADHR